MRVQKLILSATLILSTILTTPAFAKCLISTKGKVCEGDKILFDHSEYFDQNLTPELDQLYRETGLLKKTTNVAFDEAREISEATILTVSMLSRKVVIGLTSPIPLILTNRMEKFTKSFIRREGCLNETFTNCVGERIGSFDGDGEIIAVTKFWDQEQPVIKTDDGPIILTNPKRIFLVTGCREGFCIGDHVYSERPDPEEGPYGVGTVLGKIVGLVPEDPKRLGSTKTVVIEDPDRKDRVRLDRRAYETLKVDVEGCVGTTCIGDIPEFPKFFYRSLVVIENHAENIFRAPNKDALVRRAQANLRANHSSRGRLVAIDPVTKKGIFRLIKPTRPVFIMSKIDD